MWWWLVRASPYLVLISSQPLKLGGRIENVFESKEEVVVQGKGSKMPIFKTDGKKCKQIKAGRFSSESELQTLVENNLEELLDIRFIASEFQTGERHGGRIDTLGLDASDAPVIIEYKYSQKESIINQGLFYLDWLIDHKGDFEVAMRKRLGPSGKVDWDQPRLVLIAESFSKYDTYAVNRIGENIELKRYVLYEEGTFLLEDVITPEVDKSVKKPRRKIITNKYSIDHHLKQKPLKTKDMFYQVQEQILAFDEKVTENPKKFYIGYRVNKNFCEIEVQKNTLKIHIDLPVSKLSDPKKLCRDMRKVGHYGTGMSQALLEDAGQISYLISLIKQSYEAQL